MMRTVYLSLGSNLGDRAARLREALRLLEEEGVRVVRVSPVYETAPQGFRAQSWFLNLVAECETELFPRQLLGKILSIERRMGRRLGFANGPRIIDIDIVLYGREVIRTKELTVPHPRMSARRFVLEPLADLDPTMAPAASGKTVRELLRRVQRQRVRRIPFV